MADALAGPGWCVQGDALPPGLADALADEIEDRVARAALAPAGIGRVQDHRVRHDIRMARTDWMTGETQAQRAFLDWAEALREGLNQRLFLGLFDFEASFAAYPAGGFYDRHLDSFEGARNRVVSLIVYLNRNWLPGHGGALAIHAPGAGADEPPIARIPPRLGDAVFLLSERIPHAVEPTRVARHAIAAWWRVNQTRGDRVDPPA